MCGGTAVQTKGGRASRSLALKALVVTAILGSAFAFGRSLAPDRASVTTAATPLPTAEALAPRAPTPGDDPTTAGSPESPVVDGSHSYDVRRVTGTSTVALTFDDGPDPRYTPQILRTLREFGVTATFCVVGRKAHAHPELIRAIVADGHTLCNHSWDHDIALGSRTPDQIRADLLRTGDAIHAAVPGVPIAYYRQPGGAWTYPIVSTARELGLIPLHWTVDPWDWQAPGADAIAASVLDHVGPGAIVLLHDSGGPRQGTVDALYQILPELTAWYYVAALPPGTT